MKTSAKEFKVTVKHILFMGGWAIMLLLLGFITKVPSTIDASTTITHILYLAAWLTWWVAFIILLVASITQEP